MKYIGQLLVLTTILIGGWNIATFVLFEINVCIAGIILNQRQPKYFIFNLHNVLLRSSFHKRLCSYLVNLAEEKKISLDKVSHVVCLLSPYMYVHKNSRVTHLEYDEELQKLTKGDSTYRDFRAYIDSVYDDLIDGVSDPETLFLINMSRDFFTNPTLFAEYALQVTSGFKMAERIHRIYGRKALIILADTSRELLDAYQETHPEVMHLFPKEQQFCVGDVHLFKPKLEVYQHVLTQMNIPAHETVYIDNVLNNVEGAQRAGMIGVFYSRDKRPASFVALKRYLS